MGLCSDTRISGMSTPIGSVGSGEDPVLNFATLFRSRADSLLGVASTTLNRR